jgi:hypothetical protein
MTDQSIRASLPDSSDAYPSLLATVGSYLIAYPFAFTLSAASSIVGGALALAVVYITAPVFIGYASVVLLGSVIVNASAIVERILQPNQTIRVRPAEFGLSDREFLQWVFPLVLLKNIELVLGTVVAAGVLVWIGSPALAFVVALGFVPVDLSLLGSRVPLLSPSLAVVVVALSIFHAAGVLTDVTADVVRRRARRPGVF